MVTEALTSAATRPPCPICAAAASRQFASRSVSSRREATFFICSGCGLHFQRPDPEEDGRIFADVECVREKQGKKPEPGKQKWWQLYDENVLRRAAELTPGRRLLDVGSGDGRFLLAARQAGFACEGVDISPELAADAQRASGVPVHVGALPELRLPAESFDVVNLDLVLMYVPDPLALMQEIARLLAPGGICRVREFLNDSLNARMHGPRWWFYADTTLRAYSRKSMSALARRSGLVTARVFRGTDATRETWRSQLRHRSGKGALESDLRYLLRRAHLLGRPLAGEVIYYLRKPTTAPS
ncbi:MAG: class I SAM-dependent methyltransferase [Armatimonadota bacterium]